jgi:copper homeostasis protein
MIVTPKVLEVCCFSLFSSQIAQLGGASRIELCGGFLAGGTTPSLGLIQTVLSHVSMPVYVMIRPRGGDFLYSHTEWAEMLADIQAIKALRPAGFVFGALDMFGGIDVKKMQMLLDEAKPFPVTFHRAFDRCAHPQEAIEQLVELGVENILTSGQKPTAIEGVENLKRFVGWANKRINVMAGAGVLPSNIEALANIGIRAFHFSAKERIESSMIFRNQALGESGEFEKYEANLELIRATKALLKND